ncbi:MAG: NlpC/P60 family protein [Candidatus Acidiferrales bacterium]
MESPRTIFAPPEDEERIRRAVVEEALSWIGTPFVDHACLKGAGVDCGMLVYACYLAAGLDFGSLKPGYYSTQWFLGSTDEVCLNAVKVWTREVPGPPERIPKPGDIVLFKTECSNLFNHSGVVTKWPQVVHAMNVRLGVAMGDVGIDVLRTKTIKIFSPW